MGLFGWLFPNREKNEKADKVQSYFKTMNAYTPSFTTYNGGIYEMELTRAAIHAFATSVSKLKPEFIGDVYSEMGERLQFKMNDHMDTSKFLYRLATILSVNTTAFIIPLYHDDMVTIKGYYPLLPYNTEVIDVKGEPWLRYTFPNGSKSAIELEHVGVLTQYQFKNEFFGDGNEPLLPTLTLLDIQRQGMMDAVKQSAVIRFMAKLGMNLNSEDIAKEREQFSSDNLSADNQTGIMMFDNKYTDVKQIDSKPYVIDKEQMELIKDNVYSYFGVNEDIIQNKFDEDTWNAFYEGKIEPFALQLGLVMTNMTFTDEEVKQGNYIMFTSNRLQYASNRTKLQVSTQLFDRGILTTNQINDIWNLPRVEGGDDRYIRKEYARLGKGEYASDRYEGISEFGDDGDTGDW